MTMVCRIGGKGEVKPISNTKMYVQFNLLTSTFEQVNLPRPVLKP